MKQWPLKFREFGEDILFTDDAGGFFVAAPEFLERTVRNEQNITDWSFLVKNGHAFENEDSLEFMSFATRWAKRIHVPGDLGYVILVPTLRCDLACDYCQVSRVQEQANGFDWTETRLIQVISWLNKITSRSVKIEFQGGEPLLRLDLLERIRSFCRNRFSESEFVVCTNLQKVSEDAWAFLSAKDTFISTSFDGTTDLHTSQRTRDVAKTNKFQENVIRAIKSYGASKLSALPTIDPLNPPAPSDLIKSYGDFGLQSIFLRKVNYQGFARKKYNFEAASAAWYKYYRDFIFAVIDHNKSAKNYVQEYYLTHLMKRILQGGHNGNVDLRSPSWLGSDFILIDYDGKFYPTDEARMVTRIGKIDLSIGNLSEGISEETVATLNAASINQLDPDCMHCVYQQYCGLNVVDDLSRYGRIDLPRHMTSHCQTHLFLFDLAFELLYSKDDAVQNSVRNWLGLGTFPSPLIARHE